MRVTTWTNAATSFEPARGPRSQRECRLAVLERRAPLRFDGIDLLTEVLQRGDALVLNDAATLPASLHGEATQGDPVEARLMAQGDDGHWRALLLGPGDWRTPTEHRPAARVTPGTLLRFPGGLSGVVVAQQSERLFHIAFNLRGAAFFRALYHAAAPVQYAHASAAWPLWAVQTAYAGVPTAAEMPSAGWALTWDILLTLRRKGVAVVALTHAAGLSSSGDAALDASLPLPERYTLPAPTANAVRQAKRVIAVGTSVTRALESAGPALVPGTFETSLRITPSHELRVVSGLLTGWHEAGSSHLDLLSAFAPSHALREIYDAAASRGFLAHELGDTLLIL